MEYLKNNVMTKVQVLGLVHHQVDIQVNNVVTLHVWNQSDIQADAQSNYIQVNRQVGYQVYPQVTNQVQIQVGNQVRDQVREQRLE
jgi:paraquat-inducible protein B